MIHTGSGALVRAGELQLAKTCEASLRRAGVGTHPYV